MDTRNVDEALPRARGDALPPAPADGRVLPEGLRVHGGRPWPLGVCWRDGGYNIAVYSEHAKRITVVLFDADQQPDAGRQPRETGRIGLCARSGDIHHAFVEGLPERIVYGLTADGPEGPAHRFDAARLLLDPNARRLHGGARAAAQSPPLAEARREDAWLFGLEAGTHAQARGAEGSEGQKPWIPRERTVLYEVHVKGFSMRHPAIAEAERGTWLGLCSDAAIEHFRSLGVTTLSLLPVHTVRDEPALGSRGLRNYWGYNAIAFFCPDPRFARRDSNAEFREMVRRLHAAGLEVVIDVVFNHTAEGPLTGPTLSWRGLDQANWYLHDAPPEPVVEPRRAGPAPDAAPRSPSFLPATMIEGADSHYGGSHQEAAGGTKSAGFHSADFVAAAPEAAAAAFAPPPRAAEPRRPFDGPPSGPAALIDFTGCGNTLNIAHPQVSEYVLDVLRHWATVYGVDGFRFDLATVLGREPDGQGAHPYRRDARFFAQLGQDPILRKLKLIAEPWDLGPGGYRNGDFPRGWTQWNDRFRDVVRDFWLARYVESAELAVRLAGSEDLYGSAPTSAAAATNFVTAHDGFTLLDLVSYDGKQNLANGEQNRDGTDSNRSWNCGEDGPSDLRSVRALRGWMRRAMLATLFVSRGTPMLLGGDEIGRTQAGNNNAYCQDNDISWFDWRNADQTLRQYVSRLIGLRHRLRALHSLSPLGRGGDPASWFEPDGQTFRPGHTRPAARNGVRSHSCFGVLISPRMREGEPALDGVSMRSVLVVINANAIDVSFRMPIRNPETDMSVGRVWPLRWELLLDSYEADGGPLQTIDSDTMTMRARSVRILEASE